MAKFKSDHGIPKLLYDRLVEYGIVTLGILCNEIRNRDDMKVKFMITNNNQCDLL